MIEDPPVAPLRYVWGVNGLLQAAADSLAARFGACAVRGEISGFARAASGHCYFNLKDAERAEGTLRCAFFRRAAALIDFAPRDGQSVDVRGRLGVYGPRGELQFIVESMQRTGAGALYERFVQLRAQLQDEGLFDPLAKRALPAFPRRIGVITSPVAAALHDVLTALARRAPNVEIIVYPSPVQGIDAPAALCAAIALAGARAEVDTLILCRGGGSLEDLWAFNDERVVRAVRASALPLLCGVGHETDVTLADLAADVRAPTPTAAAELAAPSRQSGLDGLTARAERMRGRVVTVLDTHHQRLDRASMRLARPTDLARRHGERLGLLTHRLEDVARRDVQARRTWLARAEERVRRAAAVATAQHDARLSARRDRLQALDPQRVLARGYALLTDSAGHALASVREARVGASLHAVLSDGRLSVAVTEIEGGGAT